MIQHYVIKFVSDLRQVDSFAPGVPVFSSNKTDRHDVTEILLKVALNTITLTPILSCEYLYFSILLYILGSFLAMVNLRSYGLKSIDTVGVFYH